MHGFESHSSHLKLFCSPRTCLSSTGTDSQSMLTSILSHFCFEIGIHLFSEGGSSLKRAVIYVCLQRSPDTVISSIFGPSNSACLELRNSYQYCSCIAVVHSIAITFQPLQLSLKASSNDVKVSEGRKFEACYDHFHLTALPCSH